MNDVPRDMQTIGEIVIRGDNVMDGYYKEPEATAAVMSGAWLHTGDMAIWDDETYVQIVDRKKDIIISAGENISSIEVERAIAAHPVVLECAVVSVPDPKWGEVPGAFVVVKPNETLADHELTEFLRGRLAKFKIPHRFVMRTEPLPKTGTGKILKRELRELFWEGKRTKDTRVVRLGRPSAKPQACPHNWAVNRCVFIGLASSVRRRRRDSAATTAAAGAFGLGARFIDV